jgi:hypothetical protein
MKYQQLHPKAVQTTLSVPLSCLCNQSMAVGVFPERLKYSKVKPLSHLITDFLILQMKS